MFEYLEEIRAKREGFIEALVQNVSTQEELRLQLLLLEAEEANLLREVRNASEAFRSASTGIEALGKQTSLECQLQDAKDSLKRSNDMVEKLEKESAERELLKAATAMPEKSPKAKPKAAQSAAPTSPKAKVVRTKKLK